MIHKRPGYGLSSSGRRPFLAVSRNAFRPVGPRVKVNISTMKVESMHSHHQEVVAAASLPASQIEFSDRAMFMISTIRCYIVYSIYLTPPGDQLHPSHPWCFIYLGWCFPAYKGSGQNLVLKFICFSFLVSSRVQHKEERGGQKTWARRMEARTNG